MIEKKAPASAHIYLILVALSLICILHKDIFSFYSEMSLYVIGVFVIIGIFLDKKIRLNRLGYVLIVSIYYIVALKINNGGIGSAFTFVVPIIMLFAFERASFTLFHEKIIKGMCIVLLIFSFIQSYIYASDWWYFRFNAINPNTMGMYTEFAIMCWLAFSDIRLEKLITALILLTIAIVTLINFEARAGLLIVFVYIFGIMFPQRAVTKKSILFFMIASTILGLAIPFIYISLFRNGVQYEILGKNLYTGRENIWLNMMEKLSMNKNAWLFGLGSKTTFYYDHYTNIHNNFFAVIVDFGIIGFVLFYGMLLKQVFSIKHFENRKICKLVIMFICYTFVLGMTEVTTLFSVIYPLAFLGLGWAISINNSMEGKMYG